LNQIRSQGRSSWARPQCRISKHCPAARQASVADSTVDVAVLLRVTVREL
jgi:cytochrome c-type biogenesis protein CcmH/NrfF